MISDVSLNSLIASLVIGAPQWMVPTAIVAVALVIVVVWSYSKAGRGWPLLASALKLTAIVALSICLLEPLFSGTRPKPGANAVALLVDNSESMTVRPDSTNELKAALHGETAWQVRLAQDFDLRRYAFDSQLRNVDTFNRLRFDGLSSSLQTALQMVNRRLERRPTAGIVLFTDGNGTELDTSELVAGESKNSIPIYPVLLSKVDASCDLRIDQVNVTQTNFEAAPTTIDVTVIADQCDPGAAVVGRLVSLNHDDDEKKDKAEPKVVLTEKKTLASDKMELAFRFRFRPDRTGLNFYRFETFFENEEASYEKGEARSELTLRNNVRSIVVDRGGGPYRVLYVAGRPNWEFKFLRRALDADDEIALTGLLRIARKEPKFAFRDQGGLVDKNRLFEGFDNKDEQDVEGYDQPVLVRLGVETEEELRDGFPKTAEELFSYDAVMLDDLEAKFFKPDQMVLLRRFVSERGGGLIMLGGQEAFVEGSYDRTPIGELLPVYTSKRTYEEDSKIGPTMRWSLTREGMLQPWARSRSTDVAERRVHEEMPDFLAVNRVPETKPGASVLATVTDGAENSAPALVTQRFGKGRTAALTVADMWRWSLRREKQEQDELAQHWRQLTRWLVADVPRNVEVQLSPYVPSRPMSIEVTVRDKEFNTLDNARVSLKVTTPTQDELQIDANATERSGVYAASYSPKDDGCYKVVATAIAEDGSLVGTREAGWAAEPATVEFESLVPNRKRLEQIASESGGELVEIDELDAFVRTLPNRKVPVTEPWIYPLWHHPSVFGFAVLCLCGEWGIRRWRGLP
ncbi:MAG: hypothetical protein KDB27_06970 [Planctomycetales bacterium]|nr:hypothetical protein [Planctomycetales bacterium]